MKNAVEVQNTARSATGKLPLSLQFQCDVNFRDKHAVVTCYVTPIDQLNVMGLDWVKALMLEDMTINNICNSVEAAKRGSISCGIDNNISILKNILQTCLTINLVYVPKRKRTWLQNQIFNQFFVQNVQWPMQYNIWLRLSCRDWRTQE